MVLISESDESSQVVEMKINHCSHREHPLFFFSDIDQVTETINCFGCDQSLDDDGSRYYGCKECNYYLHKQCAELELSPQIQHPSHSQHLLILLPKSPYVGGEVPCDFCHKPLSGFVYSCYPCDFGLHINCAKGGEMAINHFSHEHPLLFISDESSATEDDQVIATIKCFGCDQSLDDGSGYYVCKECKYYLHKRCGESELSHEIKHPFHPKHPLTLLPESPYGDGEFPCDFCDKALSGFLYNCDDCNFNLHINCALLQTSIAPKFPYSLHQHPLVFLPNHNHQLIKSDCSACEKPLSGPIYHCSVCYYGSDFNLHKECAELALETRKGGIAHFSHEHLLFVSDESSATGEDHVTETINCSFGDQSLDDGSRYYGCKECKYYLHKRCVELHLASQIQHPFHPEHPLTLLPKPSYDSGEYSCNFCSRSSSGFAYHCDVCQYDIHINCSLLQSSIAPNFCNPLHQHPLFSVQNHNDQLIKSDCPGCMKPLSGPIYHCSVCSYGSDFNLHKECGELPLEINHPYDRKHSLTLLPNPPAHPDKCSCYLCKIRWEGFVYSCSRCNFQLTPEDVSAPPRTITDASHKHPWTLLLRQMPFTCDFCGTYGDHTPYLCTTYDLVVHKLCISMPRNIMITRHPHVLSHSFSLQEYQFEDWRCRICYEEVISRYGSYYCHHSDCNYIAHVHCVTNKAIWDGTIIAEDYDESSMETLLRSSNLITVVSEQMGEGEQMVAIEIKHEFHDHNLVLISSGEIKDGDSQCDGCMRPISTPFYSCDQCKFGLHKECAELPKGKRHPFHKHLLMLSDLLYQLEYCSACGYLYNGFSYKCDNEDCDANFAMYFIIRHFGTSKS